MFHEFIIAQDLKLTIDDVTLLVDLFYLPFEHGAQGMWLLNEFQWLKVSTATSPANR